MCIIHTDRPATAQKGGTQTHLNSTVLGLPYQPSLAFARWPAPPQIFPFDDDFDLTKPAVTGGDRTRPL